MNDQNAYLGIDLGGTKIEIIALDHNGNSLYRNRIATPQSPQTANPLFDQYQNILKAIKTLVDTCEQQIQMQQLPLGIGIPGAISLETGLVKNANTVCLIGKDFSNDLSQSLNRNVKVENDANCFALSEATDGAGEHYNCVFAVILGTGVGGGWVINNQLHIGSNAISGEWGHNPLPWPSDKDEPKQTCYCGKLGCIETYLSGPGFSQQTQLQFSDLGTCPDIISAKETNSLANQSYRLYIDRIARSLASVINVMDPDCIVLGGGLSNINSLYSDISKVWVEYVFSDSVNTQLLKNKYGDSSGVRGAAWLNKK